MALFLLLALATAPGLSPDLVYEQVANAPHVEPEIFFANNPLKPTAGSAFGASLAPPPPVQGRPPPGPVNPPRQPTVPGVHFASTFSDYAVLQRAPSKAALYGVVKPAAAGSVTVTFSPPVQGTATFTAPLTALGQWKVLLPPMPAGGDFSATLTSTTNTTARKVLRNLTFGDLWFCSGQSNMQLPMMNTMDVNATKRQIRDLGKFKNIRLYSFPQIAVDDGHVDFTPTNVGGPWTPVDAHCPPSGCPSAFGGLSIPCWNDTKKCCRNRSNTSETVECPWVLDMFSAHCLHTFTELTTILGDKEVPFGLIESAWGGTEVQNWASNASLNAKCKNLTGGKPNQAAYPAHSGNLFNGMVLPFVNMSIKGATWFQGENNCAECAARCHGAGTDPCHDDSSNETDPAALPNVCGNLAEASGYPCYLSTMIDEWRAAWSVTPGTTAPNFPFGIQTLQSTEGTCGNGAFRWAQALNQPTLPSKKHPQVFLAQGFDAQDPIGDTNWPFGVRVHGFGIDSSFPMQCTNLLAQMTPESGCWDGTTFMMGPIHPRSKRIVGRRMALAAADLVYKQDKLISNGPTLKSCNASGSSVMLMFDEVHLKTDAVHVEESMLGGATAGYDLPATLVKSLCEATSASFKGKVSRGAGINQPANATHSAVFSPFCSSFGALSPLEIRYAVPLPSGKNVSVWIPTSLAASATKKINTKCVACTAPGVPKGCGCINGTKTIGWNSATTHTTLPPNLAAMLEKIPGCELGATRTVPCELSDFITAVRYAWSASPCCPTVDRNSFPCPPNSCPIRGWNSTLPANPFYANIVDGKCVGGTLTE